MEYKTLFDSFNARNLSFEQVAETFVENEHFEKLKMNSHSLLIDRKSTRLNSSH